MTVIFQNHSSFCEALNLIKLNILNVIILTKPLFNYRGSFGDSKVHLHILYLRIIFLIIYEGSLLFFILKYVPPAMDPFSPA